MTTSDFSSCHGQTHQIITDMSTNTLYVKLYLHDIHVHSQKTYIGDDVPIYSPPKANTIIVTRRHQQKRQKLVNLLCFIVTTYCRIKCGNHPQNASKWHSIATGTRLQFHQEKAYQEENKQKTTEKIFSLVIRSSDWVLVSNQKSYHWPRQRVMGHAPIRWIKYRQKSRSLTIRSA